MSQVSSKHGPPPARTPSKAGAVTASSSPVHVGAQQSEQSLEQRAHSRQTLSKHLGQRALTAGLPSTSQDGAQSSRSRATSTVNTAEQPRHVQSNHLSRSKSTSTSLSAGAAPSQGRRSSIGNGLPIPRSPSWRTASRKSSLALPTLSSIEGSVSDIREDSVKDSTKDSAPGRRSHSSAPPTSTSTHPTGSGGSAMKRDRSAQNDSDQRPVVKRQTTADLETSSAQTGDPPSLPHPSAPDHNAPSAATAAPGSTGKAGSDSGGWLSYLTTSRSTKVSATSTTHQANIAPGNDGRASPAGLTVDKNVVAEHTSPSATPTANESVDTCHAVQAEHELTSKPSSTDVPKSRSRLNLRAFAAGHVPATSEQTYKAPTDQLEGEGVPRASDQAGGSSTPTALQSQGNGPATQGARHVSEPSAASSRPSSWWLWNGKSEPKPPLEISQPDPSSSVHSPIDDQKTPTPYPAEVNPQGDKAIAATNGVPSTVSDTAFAAEQTLGWSAWLGSYLASPAHTTTMTYAVGTAPSVASSTATSSIAPDADETMPEPPETDITAISPTRINPLIDVVPRASWSTFFTSRTLPLQRRIDVAAANDPGQPETMEIDFGSLSVGAAYDSASMVSTSSSTGKGKRAANLAKTAGSSSPKIPQGPSAADMQGSLSTASNSSGSTSTLKALPKKASSIKAASSQKAAPTPKPKPSRPNLLLPTFEETFTQPPRSLPLAHSPATSPGGIKKAVSASLSYFFSTSRGPTKREKPSAETSNTSKQEELALLGNRHETLPKARTVTGEPINLEENGKVAVIGVHGWFIQGYLKNVVGEPTGTSTKFANMMKASVHAYYESCGVALNSEAVTTIPLEGDGTVRDRAERLYKNLMAKQEWIDAINNADRIFVASHSQGTIVSTMLVERLINEGEINGTRCMMLNMCSVSQGPFYSLYNSWTVPAYLYFETAAATELFDFQKPTSAVSKAYTASLEHILNAGVKILFVASLNDQVVPLYSALFSSLSHPNILRSIFIDSSVFETSADFMTNLVVFATRLRNSGLNCHGLDFHLSEALAGSLMGLGHSTVYDEPLVYTYAVRYLMETTSPLLQGPLSLEEAKNHFEVESFNPRAPANPYYLPWALRGIIEDTQVRAVFSDELQALRDQFETWQPKSKALQQVQAALEPLRLLPRTKKDKDTFEEAISKTDKKATAKL